MICSPNKHTCRETTANTKITSGVNSARIVIGIQLLSSPYVSILREACSPPRVPGSGVSVLSGAHYFAIG